MGKEERIVVNPRVIVGKQIIKGTGIPVDAINKEAGRRNEYKRYTGGISKPEGGGH